MSVLVSELSRAKTSGSAVGQSGDGLVDLLLVRVASAGGATRAEAIRDLSFFVAHRLSPGEWRQVAEAGLAHLIEAGLAAEKRGRYTATEDGDARAAEYLSLRKTVRLGPWPEVRDCQLIARALGLEGESTPKLKALGTPEGLRALVVQQTFGLQRRLKATPANLRGELALIALERAFGNKIKSGLGSGTGLSAKAGRLLAAQLSRRPREFASDGQLIAALAAESVEAAQPSLDVLRSAIMKRFVSELLDGASPTSSAIEQRLPATARRQPPGRKVAVPTAANDTEPGAQPPPVARPDLDEFAAEVTRRAAPVAEGWPGNRKAFISHIWPTIRDSRPEWGLSDIEFKCMLVEAHRAGRLALTSADLKNKNNIKDVQDSAISYMNTVWHFVRVED